MTALAGRPAGAVRRVVVDTDPGVDDAFAIALALASPELDVVGLTTVAGNVALRTTTRNASRVLELAGAASVPVAAGADRALVRLPERHAPGPHGPDGLWEVLDFEPAAGPVPGHAVGLLASAAAAAPLSVVAIGPLTNVALLLALHPEVEPQVERMFVMGGARLEGNVTPAAEFNVWADPEAAARALGSAIPVTLLTLDVTEQAWLTRVEVDQLAASGPVGGALAEMVRRYGASGGVPGAGGSGPIHDALAVLAACVPGVVTFVDAEVEVDTGSSSSRGATVIATRPSAPASRGGRSAAGRVEVGTSLDRDRFAAEVLARIGALDARRGR